MKIYSAHAYEKMMELFNNHSNEVSSEPKKVILKSTKSLHPLIALPTH
jgi:hypothetical protein